MFELSTKCFQSIWEDFARGQLCLMSNFSLYICVHINVSDVTELMGEFCEYVFISGFKLPSQKIVHQDISNIKWSNSQKYEQNPLNSGWIFLAARNFFVVDLFLGLWWAIWNLLSSCAFYQFPFVSFILLISLYQFH